MSMKPIADASWATDDNYSSGVDSGFPTKVEPGGAIRGQGALPDTGTGAQHFNTVLHEHGRFVEAHKDIDWLNWTYPRVTEFSNDVLDGVLKALAYRPNLSISSEGQIGGGPRWLGNKSLTPFGLHSYDARKYETDAQGGASGGTVLHPKAVYWNDRLQLWFVGLGAAATFEVLTSDDGTAWTANSVANDDDCGAILDNGTRTVICRSANGFITTDDGTVFEERTHPAAIKNIRGVAWSGSTWCAVGNGGTVLTSADGITWVDRTAGSGTVNNLVDIAWDPVAGLFCAVGLSGTVITSPDGINWTTRSADPSGDYTCIIADGNGTMFATANQTGGKNGGVLARSQDGGANWIFQHQRVLDGLQGCVIGGGRLVLFGNRPENLGSNVIGVGLGMRTALE